MIKNCMNCKYVSYEWYQNNTCKSLKAMKDLDVTYAGCGEGLSCEDVYKFQQKPSNEDCKYFEPGFWTKVAIIKNKICRKIFEFKLSRVK